MGFIFNDYWYLLLALPLFGWLGYRVWKRSDRVLGLWFTSADVVRNWPRLRLGLRIAGFALTLVALLGPYVGEAEQDIQVMGRDVYFLVDMSASMNATDVPPSRLSKVKQSLKRLVRELKGERMGLILFTNFAYVQCPLTNDFRALEMYIDILETNQFANTGTNLREALVRVAKRFEEDEGTSPDASRTVVLLTDGEDFGEPYQSALNKLKEMNVRIIPVGVGTAQGAKVPQLNDDGKVVGYMRDDKGNDAVSTLNQAALQELADDYGTAYVQLSGPKDDLTLVYQQIKNQSATASESKQQLTEHSVYQWVLIPAIACLLASLVLLPVRKPLVQPKQQGL